MKKIALSLALLVAFYAPAFGTSNKPLVIIGGKVQQIPPANALQLPNINGSTQCVHADTTGALTGTGSDCGSNAATGANPTGTAADTAVNGTATTFMRSDAAPAVQKASSSAFGIVKVDGTTVTASGGVISAAGGASFHPGFASGRYYTTPYNGVTTASLVANTLYAEPFYVPVSTTFTKISFRVVVGATSGSKAELGIYGNTNGAPGSLEQDICNIADDAGNVIEECTGKTITESAGWHWLVIGTNGTPQIEVTNGDLSSWLMGMGSYTDATIQLTGAWTYSVGALPGTFPTITYTAASHTPLIGLRL